MPKKSGSHKRKAEILEPRKRILIVCEGEKTEPNYFKKLCGKLRLQAVDVEIEGKECGAAPINVVEHAIKKAQIKNSNKVAYDEIWCVMDVEIPQHETLDKAIGKIVKKRKFNIALSNPCFEYWYILHFEKTSKNFIDTDELLGYLKKNHIQGYDKGSKDVFGLVYDKTDDAIENAKSVIREQQYDEDLRKANPSTRVHLLVESLIKMGSE